MFDFLRNLGLMEWFVIGIIALVVIVFGANGYYGYNNPNISIGIGGIVETRCIEGFKFVIGQDGRMIQILDSFGKGVPCK